MGVKLVKRRQPIFRAQPKVPDPTSQIAIDLLEARRQRLAPGPRRELTNPGINPVFGASQDGYRNASVFTFAQMEAEEGQVHRSRDRTLVLVHHQPQPALDELTNRVHNAMSRAFVLDEHAEIVGIAHEPQTPTLWLPVQLVQDDVGQQRRERAALRRPFAGGGSRAIGKHDLRFEQPMHQLQGTAIFDLLGHPVQQSLMVDPVEEFGEVDVDRPDVSLSEMLLGFGAGRGCTTAWPEPVAAGVERGLKQRLQRLEQCLLHHTIHDIRDAQPPLTAARLGNPNPTDVAGTADWTSRPLVPAGNGDRRLLGWPSRSSP